MLGVIPSIFFWLKGYTVKRLKELVFQGIEGLHEVCPNHPGDWYFTGHYPTPGGTRLVNQAFVDYVEKVKK